MGKPSHIRYNHKLSKKFTELMFRRLKQFVFLLTGIFLSQLVWADVVLTYHIDGLKDPALENVQNRLKVDQATEPQPLSTQSIQTLYQRAPQTMLEAMQPFGFFKPVIASLSLSKVNDKHWVAKFKVNPGPALNITQLDVKVQGPGRTNVAVVKVLKHSPLQQGAVLNTQDYETFKRNLLNAAVTNGYLRARYRTSSIHIDKERYTAIVTLILDTGPQYYFGHVTFHQDTYDDAFLHRFVQFKPGEDFSTDSVLQLQKDLSSTEYFSSVTVQPDEKDLSKRQVPVDVHLTPSKARRYNFGLGYGTDTGPRATTSVDFRRVTDTGNYFKSFLQISEIESNLEARYVIPGANPVNEQYFYGASVSQETPNDSRGTTEKITVGKSDVFHGWRRTMSLNYQWDQYRLREDPKRYSHLLLPTVSLTHTRVDDPVFPRQGHTLSLTGLGSAKALASSVSFFQAQVSGKYITSPGEHNRIVLRGDLGYTGVKDKDLEKVPLSLQFFAGGADSIRGYDYQNLGPGRYLLVGSTEYQYEFKKNWFATVFVDAGNAVNSFRNPEGNVVGKKQPNIDLNEVLKYSAGVGALWASPVGPMEVTVAKSITDSHKKPKLQFSMGTTL
ncbi:MAG: hypothetical protein CMF50_00095 [Legionellales bacterium]|nr:hypothetical protein [Legionellales bacterium]|tara:strand:- start:649 stop:2487 length:1839 start_codon:yes stop_codon:yes gene_type:complete